MQQQQSNAFSNITVKSVAKVALLPGILPRLQRLAEHLGQFMFMFTSIFGSVGLIDKNHPCLKPENAGIYRFRDVIGLAASNVVFDRKHLPQIVMFFVVILSIVLTAAIFLAMLASTFMHVQHAQAQIFGTPEGFSTGGAENVTVTYNKDGSEDWAMNFLYRIFGETGIIPRPADGNVGNPWFTSILVAMLKYYSLAMLVIAALMILYMLVITVTESARTGKPFGSRFDGIWAPIRLALAIGLLMPVASGGYNGAQMITLQSAVWGSNLATNVWYGGLSAMSKDSKSFFTSMMGDPGYRFVRDMFLVNLCVESIKKQPLVKTATSQTPKYKMTVNDNKMIFIFGTEDAPDFCGQVEILVNDSMGAPDELKGNYWPAKVVQGYQQIAVDFMPIPGLTKETLKAAWASNGAGNVQIAGNASAENTPMSGVIKTGIDEIVGKNNPDGDGFGKAIIKKNAKDFSDGTQVKNWMKKYWDQMGVMYYCSNVKPVPTNIKDGGLSADIPTNCGAAHPTRSLFFVTKEFEPSITAYNKWIITSMAKDANHGWTTAGVFYLRISRALSGISDVVNNIPTVTILPSNLSKAFATEDNPSANTDIIEKQCGDNAGLMQGLANFFNIGDVAHMCKKYELSIEMNKFLRGGKQWFLDSVLRDQKGVYGLMEGRKFDRSLEISEPETATNMETSNVTGPALGGLVGMAKIDSKNMNPLGTIVNWGTILLMASATAYLIGFIGNGGAWTDIAFSIGALLLIPGFVLSFWVPAIPFIHFTFAVVEWMISVLEAVIGMPLWALSLITLDGDGLGKMGTEGVKRLFEIILRPTIIILALVASIIIFTAGVSFFNSALAVYKDAYDNDSNALGAGLSNLGMLFVYVFGIYSLATACFKLIDNIPDNFGRWAGLPKGFGGSMKTGVSDLQGLIVGGAALNFAKNIGSGSSAYKKGKAADKQKKQAREDENKP